MLGMANSLNVATTALFCFIGFLRAWNAWLLLEPVDSAYGRLASGSAIGDDHADDI
jgi:hypothetical protein